MDYGYLSTLPHIVIMRNNCAYSSPDDNTIAFGLCDLGLGLPEIGYVSLKKLSTVRGPMGLPVEKDLYFTANMSAVTPFCGALQQADRSSN